MNVSNLKPVVAAIATIVTIFSPFSAHAQPAELLEKLKSASKAESYAIERALQLEWSKSGSTALDFLLRRGESALEAGEIDAAIDHLSALTDHAPDFAQGWYLRATAFSQAGYFGLALKDLEQTLALNPEHFEAIFALGALMSALNRLELAQDAFQKVLQLHPHHENAINGLQQLQALGNGREL